MPPPLATPPLATAAHEIRPSKTLPFYPARPSTTRQSSETELDDDSDFEEYSQKRSFDTDDTRRRSQTTISSYDYDEALTPNSARSRRPFDLQLHPVEGPRGPHLFRSSQVSADFKFDYALQMSPLLPKQPPARTETAFSDATALPSTRQQQADLSIASALGQSTWDNDDADSQIQRWSPQDVLDFLYSREIDASVIACFELHDINGAILLDLDFDDLLEIGIQSFGKRHQLWNAIADLRGLGHRISPQPTPFQDTDAAVTLSPPGNKKRRGRKASKSRDIITPGESVSIVAIEQLLPKQHRCEKGERCAKYRKQQRELQQLQAESSFPISPIRGGRIHVMGDPGNASTAENIIPEIRRPFAQAEDSFRPTSEGFPSVVASSDLLGPGMSPRFALQADMLDRLDKRDPQDHVRQFLNFQHIQSPIAFEPEAIPTPPAEMTDVRSESVPLFPAEHHQAYPSLHPPHKPVAHQQLGSLPKLAIPRSSSTDPTIGSAHRSATASPGRVYRLGTPASEMDVPLTAVPLGPVARNNSQSVPPNMQFHQPSSRSYSRAADWRRPSMTLPVVNEGEVMSPLSDARSGPGRPSLSSPSSSSSVPKIRDPAHHSPQTQQFGYGAECTHAGWMKKRRTKMLRHEWQDAHCRLKGTQLALYANARLSTLASDTINVDDYAVNCSSVASGGKLAAAMKAFSIKTEAHKKGGRAPDPAAFAFQLVPSAKAEGPGGEPRRAVAWQLATGKTHHFAVTTKDERIDWMRELMLAKALQQKGEAECTHTRLG